jgi:hypothetical protein
MRNDIKVIDSFLYNGEELLSFRIKYLYDYVDYFYIVESKQTHSGRLKDRYYIDDVLPLLYEYSDKIKVIKVDEFPPKPDNYNFATDSVNNNSEFWWRENYQRNVVVEHLEEHNSYILLVNDIDEIPKRELLTERNYLHHFSDNPIYIDMKMLRYNFDWELLDESGKEYYWNKAYIKNEKNVKSNNLSSLRNQCQSKNSLVIENGGWHLSYFMNLKNMKKKLNDFAHSELLRTFDPNKSIEDNISNMMNLGIDVTGLKLKQTDKFNFPYGWEKFNSYIKQSQTNG